MKALIDTCVIVDVLQRREPFCQKAMDIFRKLLRILFALFDVEDTFSIDCQLAIGSPMKDYEDAIMIQTGIRIGADCLVTRNLKDYKLAAFPVFSPEEFLAKLSEEHINESD